VKTIRCNKFVALYPQTRHPRQETTTLLHVYLLTEFNIFLTHVNTC